MAGTATHGGGLARIGVLPEVVSQELWSAVAIFEAVHRTMRIRSVDPSSPLGPFCAGPFWIDAEQ